MAGKFKVGDIVQLKSGGPKMTVNWIADNGDVIAEYFVYQFAGSSQKEKKERERFPENCVKLCEED